MSSQPRKWESEVQNHSGSLELTSDAKPRFTGCSRITDYEYLGKLGEGTFGEVSKARSKRTGATVALKKILMHHEKDGFPITALREIKLLKQLDHVNVLKLDEMAVERPKNPSKRTSMFMVTPYMDHDLSGLLENPEVQFREEHIKCYMKQLLEGCAYLHENRILHRDMKAANLLINNKGILQIADFGLARPYDDEPPKPGHGGGESNREYTTLVVTRWYRPPELLLQLRKYTTAIDMWGVGCVFGEMFKRKPILAGNTDLNQAQLIFDLVGTPNDDNMPGWRGLPGCEGVTDFGPPKPSTLDRVFGQQSSLTRSLLSELMKLDWRKRINAIDALNHPYFSSQPLPSRLEDLPKWPESHELDRRRKDHKVKPPPAPAGGSVGIAAQGEWGINGQPLPYDARGPNRRPGGRPYGNGNGQNYGRRPPNAEYRNAPRDLPPYNQPPPYDAPPLRVPPISQPYDDPHARRQPRPSEHNLPPRPPQADRDLHREPPYHGGTSGGPPRSRVPPAQDRIPDHQQGAVDTYIPSYSNADPGARPPRNYLANTRRPQRDDDRRGSPPVDYGEPVRYEESNARARGPIRYDDDGPPQGPPPPRNYDRPRSRSPRRDFDRDREYRDRDRPHVEQDNRDREYRDRDRPLPLAEQDLDREYRDREHPPPRAGQNLDRDYRDRERPPYNAGQDLYRR